MSSYLAGYGEGEERKAKLFKWAALGIPTALVLGVVLYFFLRHYPQRSQLAGFLDDMRAGNVASAYTRWGCSQQNPCRDYNWERFLADFGPKGMYKDLPNAKLTEKWSCSPSDGLGGIIRVFDAGPDHELALYVAKPQPVMGFAPPRRNWRGCSILP